MAEKPKPKVKSIKVVEDHVPEVLESLKQLLSMEVLVGIPEETASRTAEKGSPINSAALGYIHEFGAPGANIPPRPWLIPGVEEALPACEPHLVAAAEAALNGELGAAEGHLEAAGMTAASSAKRQVGLNGPPLKPSTVRNRMHGRQTQSRRASELRYVGMVKGGMSPAEAQSAAGIRPLVDTGQLQRSITYVVRKEGSASTSSSSSQTGEERSYEQEMDQTGAEDAGEGEAPGAAGEAE